MDYPLTIRLAAEFIGTALLVILGNGAVANVELKGTKGHGSDWMLIAVGYGCGVMMPALMFGSISGSQINPAFTIGLTVNGLFSLSEALPYIIVQLLGAIAGQFIVYLCYKPFYDKTEDTYEALRTFLQPMQRNHDLTDLLTNSLAHLCSFLQPWALRRRLSFKII